jgi:hypothetical protein
MITNFSELCQFMAIKIGGFFVYAEFVEISNLRKQIDTLVLGSWKR